MRDYQKDLEVCEKKTPGPVKWQKFGKTYYLTGQYGMRPIIFATTRVEKEGYADEIHISNRDAKRDILIPLSPEHPDSVFVETAWESLPWYIKRCMELEDQLQQAEEMREKTSRLATWLLGGRDDDTLPCPSMFGLKNRPEPCVKTDCVGCFIEALSSPSQPSRYQMIEAVVKAAKDFPLELVEEIVDWYKIEAQEEPAGKHTNETLSGIYDAITVMTDALAAYDKAGEGAGYPKELTDAEMTKIWENTEPEPISPELDKKVQGIIEKACRGGPRR